MAVENSKVGPCKDSETIYRDVIVLGCGNILFGDDGFGPSVAEYLQNGIQLPRNVSVINAGTSVQGILFDLILSDQKPKKIIIIDAVDAKRKPGEVFSLNADELPRNKVESYTLHQMPTSNLLRELKEFCKVDVTIIAGQVDHIPEVVQPGLSDVLMKSVPIAAEEVLKSWGECRPG